MVKDSYSASRLGVVVALLTTLLAGTSEVRAQALSCTGLPHSGFATSSPASCTVNCSSGGTIASALAVRSQTTNTLTITINGICVESVDHVPSGVTLQAGSSGATLQAPSASTDPVLGISGTGVTLTNLTISGGVYTLRGRPGATFTGNNLVIEGASNANVLLDHSVATLNTSTVQNSTNDGIEAYWGSTMFLNGGTVQQNAHYGVSAENDGSIDVFGSAALQNNGVNGAEALSGGAVLISDGIVTNNAFASGGVAGIDVSVGGHVRVTGSNSSVVSNGGIDGIVVVAGGSALIENGAIIADNSGNGLELVEGGAATVRSGAVVQGNSGNGINVESGNVTVGPATIQNNKANGIWLRTNSVAFFQNSSGNQIINNTGWGILCTGTPSNPLIVEQAGTIGTVSGNGAGQVSCNIAP